MKELLIENKELVLRVYIVAVFIVPWAVAMIWHARFMNGVRGVLGPSIWVTIFPNKEVSELVKGSDQLLLLKKKRNAWFLLTLGVWLVGIVIIVVLLALLNGKL